MPQLAIESYYTRTADMAYMSCSQYKNFAACESAAMAILRGEYKSEPSTAMLVGSYVDAHFSDEMDAFVNTHPELFKKDGTLKAEYIKADEIIKRIERDEMMMRYLNAPHQVVMTGQIGGVPFKIKMDSYHLGQCIVDLKVMRDFKPIWKNGERLHWIEAWGYDLQGAIYREIERQNQKGKDKTKLPFIIAAATKEDEPDIELLSIPDEQLTRRLNTVKTNAVRYWQIKRGEIAPTRCECCNFCKSTKVLRHVIDYTLDYRMEE